MASISVVVASLMSSSALALLRCASELLQRDGLVRAGSMSIMGSDRSTELYAIGVASE